MTQDTYNLFLRRNRSYVYSLGLENPTFYTTVSFVLQAGKRRNENYDVNQCNATVPLRSQ